MFTPFELVKKQVAMHSFKAINNAQHSIDEHVHARALTIDCVPLGGRTLLSVVPSTDPAYRQATKHKHTHFGLFAAVPIIE